MDSKLLTISQAAELLGVSIQTLRRWDDSARLSSVRRKTGEHRYYFKKDIENYIKNNIKELDLFKIARNWAVDD